MSTNYIPKSVKEILEWKNGIIKYPISVELYENNKFYTEICGGTKQTDVLFSFLGIYAIGVYVYNKDKNIFVVQRNKIKLKGKNQILCSKKYLLDLQSDKNSEMEVEELNKTIQKLVDVYFDVGNLIPMWPGGNMLKGNQNNGYMDIPELFFHEYEYWFDILTKYTYSFLEHMIDRVKEERFECLNVYLDSLDIRQYKEYIDEITEIISYRNNKIKNESIKID